MAQNPGQRRATDFVAEELARRGWSYADLSRATDRPDTDDPPVDVGTIGDFLAYARWPKVKTQGRIEYALNWPPGTIRRISLGVLDHPGQAEGEPDTETVAADVQYDLNTRRPEGLSDQEWRSIVEENMRHLDYLIDKAAKER